MNNPLTTNTYKAKIDYYSFIFGLMLLLVGSIVLHDFRYGDGLDSGFVIISAAMTMLNGILSVVRSIEVDITPKVISHETTPMQKMP